MTLEARPPCRPSLETGDRLAGRCYNPDLNFVNKRVINRRVSLRLTS